MPTRAWGAGSGCDVGNRYSSVETRVGQGLVFLVFLGVWVEGAERIFWGVVVVL